MFNTLGSLLPVGRMCLVKEAGSRKSAGKHGGLFEESAAMICHERI
jgi:hypothetical protein